MMVDSTNEKVDMPPPYCPLCNGEVVNKVKKETLLTKCKSCGLLQTDELPLVIKVRGE